MEGIKLANDKYFGGEELFRGLFGKYGNDIYKMLLARYNDPRVAREMLKSIFQEAYRIIVEAGTIDITSLWLRALAESVVSKQQRPALAAQPTMAQPTMIQPAPQAPFMQAQPTMAQPIMAQQTTPQAPFMQAQATQPIMASPTMAQPTMIQPAPQAPFMQAPPTMAPPTIAQSPFVQAQASLAQTSAAQVKPPPGFIRSVQPSYEPYIPSGKLQEKEKPRNTGRIILLAGLSVMILFTVWMLVGLLMDVQVIPNMDLGYTWFNQNIFNLF